MFRYLLKVIPSVLILITGFQLSCCAQYHIPLDSVAKLTFIASAPWWNGPDFRKIEVVPENDQWNVYHLESHSNKSNDVNRKFVKIIAKKDISRLLKFIGDADTEVHIRLFNINKKLLLKSYDTLLPLLKPRQRKMIGRVISSKTFLYNTINYVVHRSSSDLSSYLIAITTKGGKEFNISGYTNYQVYAHLPWTIGDIKCYDPRISQIFDTVVGDKNSRYVLDNFYREIAFWGYLQNFETPISQDNLKADFPLAYKLFTNTFKPIILGDNNGIYNLRPPQPKDSLYYTGGFKSPLLPKYVEMYFNFKPADTTTILSRIRYVDSIKGYFNKSNFLSNYLENHPGTTMRFRPAYTAYNKDLNFRSIRKVFTGMANYNTDSMQIVQLIEKPDVRSTWLLLPDNTVLLVSYPYKDRNKEQNSVPRFMGLDESLIKLHYQRSNAVCLHFDASGKLIKDYGDSPNPFFEN